MWKDNYLLFDKPFSSFDYAIAIVRSLFQISLSTSEEKENLISYKNSLNKEPEKMEKHCHLYYQKKCIKNYI